MGILKCPKCGKELMEINEKSYIERKCSDCRRLVVFNPETGIRIERLPFRETSSGCRFY